jgi:hypothetical protein
MHEPPIQRGTHCGNWRFPQHQASNWGVFKSHGNVIFAEAIDAAGKILLSRPRDRKNLATRVAPGRIVCP